GGLEHHGELDDFCRARRRHGTALFRQRCGQRENLLAAGCGYAIIRRWSSHCSAVPDLRLPLAHGRADAAAGGAPQTDGLFEIPRSWGRHAEAGSYHCRALDSAPLVHALDQPGRGRGASREPARGALLRHHLVDRSWNLVAIRETGDVRKARCCDPSAGRFGVKEDMLNIQLCTEFGCPQWAQWRVTTPEIDEDGKPTGKL